MCKCCAQAGITTNVGNSAMMAPVPKRMIRWVPVDKDRGRKNTVRNDIDRISDFSLCSLFFNKLI